MQGDLLTGTTLACDRVDPSDDSGSGRIRFLAWQDRWPAGPEKLRLVEIQGRDQESVGAGLRWQKRLRGICGARWDSTRFHARTRL